MALTRRSVMGALVAIGAGARANGQQATPAASGSGVNSAILPADRAHQLARAGDILLVDIRRPEEWAMTGSAAPGARLDMRRDDFAEALAGLVGEHRDAPIALICARGVRSARMTRQLTEAGFTNIIDVPEGMLGSGAGPGWLKRGLPLHRN